MPTSIRTRNDANIFTDIIIIGGDQYIITGNLEQAKITLGEGEITGRVKIVPTVSEGNRKTRSYLFETDDGQQYPFGEETLSAASRK